MTCATEGRAAQYLSDPPADRFHFHPRATNPELWRTTLPLVVYERCEGHKGLIATWMAVHWLIVLHAAAGRRDFGVREIAARACVGRNELTGPRGHIQRLVDLGLLRIVGYDDRGGQFRAPRPIYHLDLWELERLSLELIPDVLRAQNVPPPPRPAPDPRQTSFLDSLDDAHKHGTAAPGTLDATPAGLSRTRAAPPPTAHGNGTGARALEIGSVPVMHENGTGYTTAVRSSLPENATATHQNGTGRCETGQPVHDMVPASHGNGTASADMMPGLARNRDVEGEKEREKERESEHARTRELLQEVAAQAAQVVIQTLQQQGVIGTTLTPPSEAPPADQPPLPDTLIALWQGDRGAVGSRDRHQLQMLAAEYDGATGGHGAYWVGRAILIADRCFAERGQALNFNYLRGMLRRWQREGSWGSDLEGEAGEAAGPPSRAALPLSTQVPLPDGREGNGTLAAYAPLPADTPAPPAVAAYIAAFNRTPNAIQAEQIVATVSNLTAWRQVLTDWQANGWKEGAVANMLDRYRKEAHTPPDDGPPVSVTVIHRYPGLSDQQRDRWIARFHAAATPAEKRAVLNRLEQEHPR